MSGVKKETSAATEAKRKLHEELSRQINAGKTSINQAREQIGLKKHDDPTFDAKMTTLK